MSTDRSFSFEFSPPRNGASIETFLTEVQTLNDFQPEFMTVTYGAGGSKKDGTLQTLQSMKPIVTCAIGSHLTHRTHTKSELDDHLDVLWDQGITHLVALRGDIPQDYPWTPDPYGSYYNHTNEFVAAAKRRHNFNISVAAYPEKHPEAPSLEQDILNLKKKCDAGADRAITQFFFDNDLFYKFRDAATKAGITTPIVPGLIRILNFKKMEDFAANCQASVPASLKETFARAADPATTAADTLKKQVDDLLTRGGVDHIHFYTMNQSKGLGPAITCFK